MNQDINKTNKSAKGCLISYGINLGEKYKVIVCYYFYRKRETRSHEKIKEHKHEKSIREHMLKQRGDDGEALPGPCLPM